MCFSNRLNVIYFIGKVGYLDTLEKGSVVVYGPFRQAAEG